MPFPESDRIVYSKTPLKEVICQLRFPTILRIGTDDIAIFQDRIRQEYPFYEMKEATIEFVNVPKEFSALFDKLPFPKSVGTSTRQFLNKDKKRFVALSQDFIAYSDTKYEKWEIFKDEVIKTESAFREIFKPAFYSRIGLRYRDVIIPSELGLSDKKLNDLLRNYILGELGDNRISSNITDIKTQTTLTIPDIPGAQVILKHGLSAEGGKEKLAYFIDADFWVEQTEEKHGTFNVLDTFHKLAGRLFRWAITDSLHEAMGPENPK